MSDYEKVLRCLNKLNYSAGLPADHRWVSTVRHYIKDKASTSLLSIEDIKRHFDTFAEDDESDMGVVLGARAFVDYLISKFQAGAKPHGRRS
jgi:hypothetical protein